MNINAFSPFVLFHFFSEGKKETERDSNIDKIMHTDLFHQYVHKTYEQITIYHNFVTRSSSITIFPFFKATNLYLDITLKNKLTSKNVL